MNRDKIYKALDGERWYQDEKWKGEEHENHEVESFMTYMDHHLTLAKSAISVGEKQRLLHELRKVTALGVACFEKHGVPLRDINDKDVPKATKKNLKKALAKPTKENLAHKDEVFST